MSEYAVFFNPHLTSEQLMAVLAERERCRQLFLAYAFDAHGWKLKDGWGDNVRDMLADIDSGETVTAPLRFLDPNPSLGIPTIGIQQPDGSWNDGHHQA